MAFRLDRATFDRLIDAYEAVRTDDGMGTSLHYVTPRQRVDALQVCTALYAAGSVPPGDQTGFWLSYLRPVLAETRHSAAALTEVLGRLERDARTATEPGPEPIEEGGGDWESDEKAGTGHDKPGWLARLHGMPRHRVIAFAAVGLLLCAAIGWAIAERTAEDETVIILPPPPPAEQQWIPATPLFPPSGDVVRDSYRDELALVLQAVDQFDSRLTPRALAAVLAAEAPHPVDASALLAQMLRRFPLDPNAPIPRSAYGAAALRHYAAVAAPTTLADDTALFEPLFADDADVLGAELAGRLAAFAAQEAAPAPPPAVRETWPWWLPLLPFLVLLPGPAFVVWSLRDLRRAVVEERMREALWQAARAVRGERGRAAVLQTSLVLMPPLPPASRTARRLLRLREPRAGTVLDVPRSLKATMASSGDLVTLMRPASQAVDFVFLVRRMHRHDHERARVLRLLDALAKAGVPLTAYEYDIDPRSLVSTARSDAGALSTSPRTLDLRGLRELHAEAVLVLVTDGRELVDAFSQRPHAYCRDELRSWPRRMLLTPVPTIEWGEREMRLALALQAPVGRATMAGLADLGLGLGPDDPDGRPARALRRAKGHHRLIDCIACWAGAAPALIAPDTASTRPDLLSGEDSSLMQEFPPSAARRKEVIDALHRFLGPGFFWFAACGIYPQLRVDITLWLGTRLHRFGHPANDALFDEALLERLAALPWFRAGRMPDWLRTAAFAALSEREKAMSRAAMAELFDRGNQKAEGEMLSLPVWRPDWRGQRIPADEVLLDLRGGSTEIAVDRDAVLRAARQEARWRWFMSAAARLSVWIAWAIVSWMLWPSPGAAPHSHGAWWPLIGFVSASLVLGASTFVPAARRTFDRLYPSVLVRFEKPLPAERRAE